MYFDPGFGSLIIQVIVAGLAAVGACWAIMKGKVKGIFGKKEAVEEDHEDEADEEVSVEKEAAEIDSMKEESK